jgi:hypothetical protein
MNALGAGIPSRAAGEADVARLRHGAREYLECMSQELSEIAFKNGWDSLAVLFEMARQEAERIRRSSDEHLDRGGGGGGGG